MKMEAVGIDLGKTVFHLVALDERGKEVVKKRLSPAHLLAYTANLSLCLVGALNCIGSRRLFMFAMDKQAWFHAN